MVVQQTLRSLGGYVGAVAGAPARVIAPRAHGRQEYDETLRTLSVASVEKYFNAFKDVDWDAPEMAAAEDDERWILPALDLLGAHPWYQSLPKARQIEVGRHRLTAMVKTGSQFEQLLLLGGTQFLMGVDNGDPEFRYFMHELTEETHHIQMFQEFTNRVCPDVSGAPGWLMRTIPLVGHLGGLYPALFFSIILAGEEPIDHVQKEVMRSGGTHPLLDQIMAIHIAEEARHIGFAHAWLEEHAPGLNPVSRVALGLLTPLAMRIGADAIIIPSRADRDLMGLPDSVVREVWGSGPQAVAFRQHLFADVRMLFDNLGLRSGLTRWSWRILGVDGPAARFRADPGRVA